MHETSPKLCDTPLSDASESILSIMGNSTVAELELFFNQSRDDSLNDFYFDGIPNHEVTDDQTAYVNYQAGIFAKAMEDAGLPSSHIYTSILEIKDTNWGTEIQYKGFNSFALRSLNSQKYNDVISKYADYFNRSISPKAMTFAFFSKLENTTYGNTFSSNCAIQSPRKRFLIEGASQLLESFVAGQSNTLLAHGLDSTGENIIKLWAYQSFLAVPDFKESIKLDRTQAQAEITTARICELMKAGISDYLSFLSLTSKMEKHFSYTSAFEYSIETLKELDDFPLDYIDKIAN